MAQSPSLERGHVTQEFSESSTGNVTLFDIMYSPSSVDDFGIAYDDPRQRWIIDHFEVLCTGSGTIQFFAVDPVTGLATKELTPALDIDDIKTPLEAPCNWQPGPQRDVSYTTTGGVNVQVRLQARLIRGGWGRYLSTEL